MSGRAELFLGIIAFATLATAIVQIGVLVTAGLLARRVQRLIDHIDEELKPIIEHVQSIARDASRATSLATAQVERVDRAINDLLQQVDRTLNAVQGFVSGPMKEGAAWFSGVRTIFSLLRDLRSGRPASRSDEEDALFI